MTKPWPLIVSRYRDYKGEELSILAMLTLSEYIENSNLANSLFAWTSMFDLCITQTEVTHPYHGPYLLISPVGYGLDTPRSLAENGKIEFRYIDTYVTEKQWHRIVSPDDVVLQLLKFLKQLHWISAPVFQKRSLTK